MVHKREDLTKFIHNEPLLINEFGGLQDSYDMGDILFMGIGGGRRLLTRGVPFDVIMMLLASESIARKCGIDNKKILIADEVTRINDFPFEKVDAVSVFEYKLFKKIINYLGFENWEILRQSDFIQEAEYSEIFHKHVEKLEMNPDIVRNSMKVEENGKEHKLQSKQSVFYDYFVSKKKKQYLDDNYIFHFALELADIDYLLKGNGIKLGWKMPGPKQMDEETPNKVYMNATEESKNINFLYTKPGIRISPIYSNNRLEYSVPYICYFPITRILFHPEENVSQKVQRYLQNKDKSEYNRIKKYYNNILREYDRLTGREMTGGTFDKVQKIIDEIFIGDSSLKNVLPTFFKSGLK